jgi:hypothetical protein
MNVADEVRPERHEDCSKKAFSFSVRRMSYVRISCLAILVISFEACRVTEQTPEDVSQKFKEGIKGNGQIVPEDKDRSQTSPSANSPVTKPAAAPAGIPETSPESQ